MLLETQIERLQTYYQKHGRLPTYHEMRDLFRYKSKSTAYYKVNRLIREGILRRKNHRLLPGQRFKELRYFRSVRAGFPSPAEEETNDRLSLDQFLIDKPNSSFLLRLKDDSMQGAGVFPGDIAIVERCGQAKPGQMIAINLDGQITLKNLRLDGKRLYLESANDRYPTLPLDCFDDHELVGVIRGIVRKF